MGTDEKRILALLNKLYSELFLCKPGDRSWLDRVYAVAMNDTEHLLAYWALYAEHPPVAEENAND